MITRVAVAACVLAAPPALASDPAPQVTGQTTAQTAPVAPVAPVAPAAVPATSVAKNDIEKKDPMICQRVEEIGSRLRAKKICMSKSQWEEQRRGDRSNIERSQIQRGMDPVG
ncbi:hypothetical protein [Novosphingobium sp. PhB55]|uniref:hypothetical protein n=1 Tax=Novosphingobium sp. PhB55 TaxID=2485106 RepID=UPI001AB05E28|nr:hypothetical protein [Novosphingobium sp. PhB55]